MREVTGYLIQKGFLKFAFLLMLIFAVAALPAYGKPSADDLDAFIRKARSEYKVPGVAVAVVHEGKVVLLKGYGVRRLGDSAPVDENTIFQLASNTKSFTAAALGTQVDAGKISWDDTVVRHLPGFALKDPYPSYYATIRDLLAHRTGLPSFRGDLLGNLGYSRDEILSRVRFIVPDHSFREQAAYSNIGFFIAGQVLGKVAGAPWEEVVRQRLVVPLGMSRSGFSEKLKDKNVAEAHAIVAGKLKVIPWDKDVALGAAGSMTSTASDMVHWMRMQLSGGTYKGHQILRPETVQEMHLPSMVDRPGFSELPPINLDSGFSYGLGWGSYCYQGHMVVEKGGALDGVRTIVMLVPDQKLGVTVLANLNLTVLPEAIRAYVLEQYLGKSGSDLQKEIHQRAAKLQEMLKQAAEPKTQAPHSRPLAAYAGLFKNELYGNFTVVQDGKNLLIKAGPAEYPGKLRHQAYDTFILTWPHINAGSQEVTFAIDMSGKAASFSTETLGDFKRITKQ
jgi:CubicO group peptidase (beta-lactamase class C family)